MRIAQYGTKHGHAAGKLLALRRHPEVEVAGVYEPDAARREQVAGQEPYAGVRWFRDEDELLGDGTITAVAAEGRNDESLAQAAAIIKAGKHLWYDKPAGEDWPRWQGVVAEAERQGLHIQMGYMFRYHHGFEQIASWARGGLLGRIFAIRAHMSTAIGLAERAVIARHPGGICYDLAGHMIDQIVWLLGRPERATAFLQDSSGTVPGFMDNTLAVLVYPRALASVDIAAHEPPPPARRFEVYGEEGSAIMEPFEPAGAIRLCLAAATGSFRAGEQQILVPTQTRQELYDRELAAFVATLNGERPQDRPLAHELLVQETLLRVVKG